MSIFCTPPIYFISLRYMKRTFTFLIVFGRILKVIGYKLNNQPSSAKRERGNNVFAHDFLEADVRYNSRKTIK